MERRLLSALLLFPTSGLARADVLPSPTPADVSPLIFFFDGYFCIAAFFFAASVAWAGIWWARRRTRIVRQKYGVAPDEEESTGKGPA
jgi:hypothetical protein